MRATVVARLLRLPFLPRVNRAVQILAIEPEATALGHADDGNVAAQSPVPEAGVRDAEIPGRSLRGEQPWRHLNGGAAHSSLSAAGQAFLVHVSSGLRGAI